MLSDLPGLVTVMSVNIREVYGQNMDNECANLIKYFRNLICFNRIHWEIFKKNYKKSQKGYNKFINNKKMRA